MLNLKYLLIFMLVILAILIGLFCLVYLMRGNYSAYKDLKNVKVGDILYLDTVDYIPDRDFVKLTVTSRISKYKIEAYDEEYKKTYEYNLYDFYRWRVTIKEKFRKLEAI